MILHARQASMPVVVADGDAEPIWARTMSCCSARDTYVPRQRQRVQVYCWCGTVMRSVTAADVRRGLTHTCRSVRCAEARDKFLGAA